MKGVYTVPPDLVLGKEIQSHVPEADQRRQRAELEEILRRLRTQPGVILADEVGMGKTFVALAIAYSIAMRTSRGPVIVMVPANLVDKWKKDVETFCELYVQNRTALRRRSDTAGKASRSECLRYAVARNSVELMKLLDDVRRKRCHLIFLAHGAMSRSQSDKWVRLALIAGALRRHGRGKANRLIQVKSQIHRFLARLLRAIGQERAQDLREELWQCLLRTDPRQWKNVYNGAVRNEERLLDDDPVPKAVIRAMKRVDLKQLADALKQMPIRARGGDARLSDRLDAARRILREVEERLWKELLAEASWRSPLLVMDEAHHLKNPGTSLARQLQSPDLEQDLRTGDGAMAKTFDRMLFLTATPFQLGHHELVHVLERFGDVRWDVRVLGNRGQFLERIAELRRQLDQSQRFAIALQKAWSHLRPEDVKDDVEAWWSAILGRRRESLLNRARSVVDAYERAKASRDSAEAALRLWIVRHNKGTYWPDTKIIRRRRIDGAAVPTGNNSSHGLPVPPEQLLPFFLAARSAVKPGQDLLGEALSSSYEAFRNTRRDRVAARDEQEESSSASVDRSYAPWYLNEFDQALERMGGSIHPKVHSTVKTVADLWEAGEKVLVFAFYRHTCRALRIHISQEIERRITRKAQDRLIEAGRTANEAVVDQLLKKVQRSFFDQPGSPGYKAVTAALDSIIHSHNKALDAGEVSPEHRVRLARTVRRFLRSRPTLVGCFPMAELGRISPEEAVKKALAHRDGSGISWKQKFDQFIELLAQSSDNERELYLEATESVETGRIHAIERDEHTDGARRRRTLPNIQIATGDTRREARSRLMLAFNTPFFPDILVCSEVMGEGVDLQRFCRHVIHHDLAWNPSQIEQRTGRIDRLGCKAEGRHSIVAYLPYLAGAADERQYHVMSDREQWFRVVMGQDEVAKLITADSSSAVQLPTSISDGLSFKLGLAEPAG